MIRITAKAANQLRDLLVSRGDTAETAGLRLAVQKGGCAGLQYTMQVGTSQQGDITVSQEGVQIFISPDSALYLNGCEIDFVDDLADRGFRILNPNAARSCGCGTSFEPTAAVGTATETLLPEGDPCPSEKVA